VKVQLFDPPMCCPTGCCGPNIDPVLLEMQETILELQKLGVEVERYSLSHQIIKFMQTECVAELVNAHGKDILPITLVDGKVFKTGAYPGKDELLTALGLKEV